MKQIKRYLCHVTSSLAIVFLSGHRAEAMTLIEALTNAYTSNPSLLAAQAQLRAKDEEVAEALSHWRPTVQGVIDESQTKDAVSGGSASQDQLYSGQYPASSYAVTLTEPIYRGGRTIDEVNEAVANVREQSAALDSMEQRIFLEVITDYCDIVSEEAELHLRTHNQQYLSQELLSAQAQFAAGGLSRTDVAQAKAASEQAKAERYITQADLLRVRSNFLRDAGLDAGDVQYPASSFDHPETSAAAVDIALVQNPDVISTEFKEIASELAVSAEVDQALPQIDFTAAAEHLNGALFRTEHENVFSAGIRLTVPIYSGGALEATTRAARQSVEANKQETESQRASVKAATQSAWDKMKADELAIGAYAEQVNASKTALEGVEHQQISGERTLLDVLIAEQSDLQSKVNLNKAQHDEILDEFSLGQALGLVTAQHMKLPASLYDPDDYLNQARSRWFGFGIK